MEYTTYTVYAIKCNPDHRSRDFSFPDPANSSKHFTLNLPVFQHKTRYGERIIAVDPNEVKKYLDLNDEDVARLTRRFIYPTQSHSRLKNIVLDRKALAEKYQELIQSGLVNNQAELSRHLGVSRAWITKIMNTLKSNPIQHQ